MGGGGDEAEGLYMRVGDSRNSLGPVREREGSTRVERRRGGREGRERGR